MRAGSELFRIDHGGVLLTWSGSAESVTPGTLIVRSLCGGEPVVHVRQSLRTRGLQIGPALFEDKPYLLWVESNKGGVEIRHRDPRITSDLTLNPGGTVLYGTVRFVSAAGYSDFEVWVAGQHLLTIIVEVFPSKLDYKSDFRSMLAEVQAHSAALALDLMSATYLPASVDPARRGSSGTEWMLILESIIKELTLAIREIERSPIWTLEPRAEYIRPERVKRTNNTLQMRLVEKGLIDASPNGLRIDPSRTIVAVSTRPRLDGPENRWLRQALSSVIRRLASLADYSQVEELSRRQDHLRQHLGEVANRLRPLLSIEPLAEAPGSVSMSFASLRLMTRPGYREAYRLLNLLKHGLTIEGQAVNADLKNIAALYEYWCFLSLVRLTSELLGRPSETQNVVSLQARGVRVDLARGSASKVKFRRADGLSIELAYNRAFSASTSVLFDQLPDILVSFRDSSGSEMHLVVDAKYRLDRSLPASRFGIIAPPADAINALYRYRDAIVRGSNSRCVVEAVAAYPASADESASFESSTLCRAIEEFGVGAIPFLPGNEEWMLRWLERALSRASWETAGRLPPHTAAQLLQEEHRLASKIVFVDVIPKHEREKRISFFMSGQHYVRMPGSATLDNSKAQRRRLLTNSVALFDGSAVSYAADIVDIAIVKRSEIDTPYASTMNQSALCALYTLSNCRELPRSIPANAPVSGPRWTSGLSLLYSRSTTELLIELEEEWMLYKALQARSIQVSLRAEAYREQQTGGHVIFLVGRWRVRSHSSGAWSITRGDRELLLPSIQQVLELLMGSAESSANADLNGLLQ